MISPGALSWQLKRLAPTVNLAAEKVKYEIRRPSERSARSGFCERHGFRLVQRGRETAGGREAKQIRGRPLRIYPAIMGRE